MDQNLSILDKKAGKDDEILDSALRPKSWQDYVGQEKIKDNIKIIITAAKNRGQVPDHLLFYGNSGLGKTTLAHLVALEMGKQIRITSGPALERAGDFAALFTNFFNIFWPIKIKLEGGSKTVPERRR